MPASLPLSKSVCIERSRPGERSEALQTRSIKSGPGRLSTSFEIDCDVCLSSSSAFAKQLSDPVNRIRALKLCSHCVSSPIL